MMFKKPIINRREYVCNTIRAAVLLKKLCYLEILKLFQYCR